MSTDYRIKICRKVDNKCLGIFNANHLKSILDSEYAGIINCSNRNCDKAKFTRNDLVAVSTAAFDKIKELYRSIDEKKLLMAFAQNVEIKRELEDEIFALKEDIEEQHWPLSSAYILVGEIDCIVEDLWNKDDTLAAYEYNGLDLPEKENTYGDGKKYKYHQTIWSDDVYCVVEANC